MKYITIIINCFLLVMTVSAQTPDLNSLKSGIRKDADRMVSEDEAKNKQERMKVERNIQTRIKAIDTKYRSQLTQNSQIYVIQIHTTYLGTIEAYVPNATICQSEINTLKQYIKTLKYKHYSFGSAQTSDYWTKSMYPYIDKFVTFTTKTNKNYDQDGQSNTAEVNYQSNDINDIVKGTSQIQGSIFDAPSGRDYSNIFNYDLQKSPIEIKLDDLDAYTGNAIVISGTKVNTQIYEPLIALSYGGTHKNIFTLGEKRDDLYEWQKLEEYLNYENEQKQREFRKQRDIAWYEATTPWYDKKIDYYDSHSCEELNTIDFGLAVAAKGVVVTYDKIENFVVDGIPKLVNGQAKKGLTEGVSAMFEFLSKGKIGKDEINAIKGYGAGLVNHHFLWGEKGAKKLVDDATGNSNVYYQQQKKLEKRMKETANTYREKKSGFLSKLEEYFCN